MAPLGTVLDEFDRVESRNAKPSRSRGREVASRVFLPDSQIEQAGESVRNLPSLQLQKTVGAIRRLSPSRGNASQPRDRLTISLTDQSPLLKVGNRA